MADANAAKMWLLQGKTDENKIIYDEITKETGKYVLSNLVCVLQTAVHNVVMVEYRAHVLDTFKKQFWNV